MAAIVHAATALVRRTSGRWISRDKCAPSAATAALRIAAVIGSVLVPGIALVVAATPALAASNKVRITNLSDVSFGAIANLTVDATRSQNICLYADTTGNGYNITATGPGPGGAFELISGASVMPYEVQWSGSSGQSSGTQLSPNIPLTGQASTATHQVCNNGPATSASLVILLRSAALSSATAGNYSGTLTLVVGPE